MSKINRKIALFLALTMICGLLTGIRPVKADDAAPVTIDADATDWYYIEPLFMGGGVISKVSAFTKADTLYFKMEVSNTSNFDTWHLYFDTDGDYTNHLYFTGAEYVLETDWMYKYEGDSGDWEGLQSTGAANTAAISDDKKVLEVSIPFDSLGNPSQIAVRAAVVGNWVDVATLPSAEEYYVVPTYEEVLKDTIVGISAAELEEMEAAKMFAGTASQWEAIDYDAVFKNSNLKGLKAVSDGEFLYIQASAKKLSNNFTVYIATEETLGGTDKSDIWTDASDMGFQLKANGNIYRMKGKTKKDMGTAMTDYYKSDAGFEIKIPISYFETEGTTFRVGLEDGGEVLPDTGKSLLLVTSPIMSDAPVITVDGNDSDWKGIEPIGEGSGTLGSLYAFRDDDNLYVMTYISGVTDSESSAAYTTSLFIDSDNDTKTGYQHVEYPLHSGANMLVQDWYSYGPDRNLEFFFTDSPVILPWNMKKQYVEGYEKVFAKTAQADAYCAEWKVPISVMKEATEAVSDDIYICVDRDDCQTDEVTYERMTPYGYTPMNNSVSGSFAKVPKYQIKFELNFTDFDFSDWNSVCNVAKHENLLNLCAVRSSDRLYTILTSAEGLATDNRYYIATDAEGFSFDGYEKVSYYIENGRLYPVTADNTKGDVIKSVYQYYSESAVLMQLYLEWIGSPKNISIAVNANSGEIVLPETGMLATTKTVDVEREAGTYYPVENYELYNNPYKGWVGWADICEGDIDDIASPYDLVYVDIKWSEIEAVKGVYDFDAIEEQYQFKKWQDKGCRMVLRFVMDNPNLDETRNPDIQRMDIPEWLYEELLEENAEGKGAGVFYTGETILGMLGGVGFSPNYESLKLLEYHRNVVQALAERYDDPSLTAYVEVGSLGHWAEFHCWPTGTGDFPDPELAQEYMQPYADYFENVKVGIRKPYALAAENNWGLYNDIFGVTSDGGTPTFLEWANSGNTDMPGSTEEDIAASKMPEWWKLNFSGGEFANGDFRSNAQNETVCAVLDQIRDSHTTWLGPCSGCDIKYSTGDYDFYAYNIETLLKTMGYRYNLQSITEVRAAAPGSSVSLKMVWNNSGVAPVYYNCPVTLMLVDPDGNAAYEQVLDTDTREWLPGRTTVDVELNIPEGIAEGTYQLAVKMNTADSMAETIYLAMEGYTEGGSYTLYPVTVTKSAGDIANSETAEEISENNDSDVKDSASVTEEDNEEVSNSTRTVIIIIGLAAVAVIIAAVVLKKKKQEV